ncbi:hypothetical protein A2Z22_00275 [Candidatus Woesebacteria bacterium RBG_16_34_12]|uniref:Type II secretion system protein GspF domain-containing protein n=1 Tax=Candidatus Woesebacteria bacterium RBG_16_34_12 TaxID=1802480 RepID=A0A1F7X8W4_9BACT|nr:MAG: hypothetical protein A2Z22_00275 [Candidatus Woesebacteria bacterium RBG_16_34_12]
MNRFKYKAKDEKGNLVTGIVEATNSSNAAKLVHEEGLIVITIKPIREIPLNFLKKFQERVTSGSVVSFTRQLATMINAGLPLTEALLILRSQTTGSMQSVIAKILADVEEGESLSTALKKHPKAFNPTYVALIKAGEVGGVMDQVLVRLADDLEKMQEFKGKVKSALIYPVIIVIGMIAVAFIMIVFVIPKLTSLYDQFDAELPITTKILIAVSDFMVKFWPIVILGFGLLVYALKIYIGTKAGKKRYDTILFKLPLIGNLQRQIILAEVTRTLSLMVGSGVSILEGLSISSEVVGNSIIAEALQDSAQKVEKGYPVAFAFSRNPDAFPFILSQMVSVGEETGKMDEVLAKVSHVFETESDQKLKALTSAVEPIILLVLGIGVAFLVISIIMPIYNLTTQM